MARWRLSGRSTAMLWIVVVVAALAGLLIFLSRQTLSNADAWASVISCLVVVAGIVSPRLVHWFRHLGNRLPLETDPQVVEPPGLAPPERPHYIRGRNDIVDDLVKALDDAPQDHRVHVLYGLAGIGKTAIVQEVSHRVRERLDRQDVWWLRADSKTMFEGSLRELTERLARRGRDPSAGIVVCHADVRQAWADGQVNRQDLLWGMLHEYRYPWLMIMDGLNDVELLGNHRQRIEGTWWLRKPATGQLVIVTTVDGNLRNFDQSWVQVHHVKSLTPANGALVLRAHAPHATDSNREVEALSRRQIQAVVAFDLDGSVGQDTHRACNADPARA